ncbi:hypothetical protein BC834DRAFT_908816, partial [Gloeopeniophorella convolvens]
MPRHGVSAPSFGQRNLRLNKGEAGKSFGWKLVCCHALVMHHRAPFLGSPTTCSTMGLFLSPATRGDASKNRTHLSIMQCLGVKCQREVLRPCRLDWTGFWTARGTSDNIAVRRHVNENDQAILACVVQGSGAISEHVLYISSRSTIPAILVAAVVVNYKNRLPLLSSGSV